MKHQVSKEILDIAYKEYARINPNPLPRKDWELHVTGEQRAKRKKAGVPTWDGLTRKKYEIPGATDRKSWLEINREYLRWRKTDDFQKWRHKQFLKQGGTCYYCDQPLAGVRQNTEHVIPKYAGGDNRRSNLVLSCSQCNREKNTTILSRREKQALRAKNKAKKGTYHLLQAEYESEYDVALRLRNMFKDE